MDATDLTIQPLVLLPRAQDGSELAGLLDFDADYAQWGDALPDHAQQWPSQTSRTPSGGGSDGVSPGRGKPRQERRSHTKSRRGCNHCKRRRIKVNPPQPLAVRWTRVEPHSDGPSAPRASRRAATA